MFNPTGRGDLQRLGPSSGYASMYLKIKRDNLLVHAEKVALELFKVVTQTKDFLICPQVHVLQLFDFDEVAFRKYVQDKVKQEYVQSAYVPNVDRLLKNWSTHRAYRSVDFLLCDAKTTEVHGGIEIDDLSHLEEARKDADEIKDMMFASVELPLYRFTNAQILKFSDIPQAQWQAEFDLLALAADAAWLQRKAHFFRAPDPIR